MRETQAPTATKTTTKNHNLIVETANYSIFKKLPHNRPVVQSHVIRLAQSMLEKPHLRPARPILCNDKMQIIDGQHRLEGGILNGQTVYYMVVSGLTIDDARLLNALQRTWSLLDYAYSYASSRVPAYVQFVKNYENRNLPPSVIMEFMMPKLRRQHEFRVGLMEPVDQKVLDMKLDQLEEVIELLPQGAAPYVVSTAFATVQKIEGYDHDRMMKKLKPAKPSIQPDRVSYIRELERIYNTDVPFNGPSYLRFFQHIINIVGGNVASHDAAQLWRVKGRSVAGSAAECKLHSVANE